MKKVFSILLFSALFITATAKEANPLKGINFTENKGQVSDQNNKPRPDVLFSGSDGKFVFHIRKDGISYQLNRIDSYKEESNPKSKDIVKVPGQLTIYRIDNYWKNCNSNFAIEAGESSGTSYNYYLENCPLGINNVREYNNVKLKNIYNGIDVYYYEKDGNLKCDYLVSPNSDYKLIQIEIKGPKASISKNGSLILSTPLGIINEGEPIVYQNKRQLKAKWILSNNVLSLDIKDYNPMLPLVIDPIIRSWGTYYGGTSNDRGLSCTVDASGNVYMSGQTQSSGSLIIATSGAHQTTFSSSWDAFLVKFNSLGIRLWGTYYGTSSTDYGTSCATDVAKNVIMTGYSTTTSTVLATSGGHQVTPAGAADAFLVKFDSTGTRIWGTYYGSTGNEYGRCVKTDASGNIYLAGSTTSTINTPGQAIWTSNGWTSFGGSGDAMLVKFNSFGVRQFGTCYGGSGQDEAFSCAIDQIGDIYLVGYTASTNFISTSGSYQTVKSSFDDGFIVKFNSVCSRQWATYYGGNNVDYIYSCTTNSSGELYIGGLTSSTNAMGSAICHQSTNGGGIDGFTAKFNPTGTRQYGSFYGGLGTDYILSCEVDPSDNLFVSGNTASTTGTVIATNGSHQNTNGGGTDAFIAKFIPFGTRSWATYYGGSGTENGNYCTIDANYNLYLCGYSTGSVSASAIATPGSHQFSIGGGEDAFLAKFDLCGINLAVTATPSAVCLGQSSNMNATGADGYTWMPGSLTGPLAYVTPTSTTIYTISGSVTGCTNTASTNYTLNVNSLPTLTTTSTASLICAGQTASLSVSGTANTYTFNPGGTGTVIAVSPGATTNYTVTGTDSNGCDASDTISLYVSACTGINESVDLNSVSIYPNPSNGSVNVELKTVPENSNIEIYNTVGQLVLRKKIELIATVIDISKLANGIYQLVITKDNEATFTRKIIKE